MALRFFGRGRNDDIDSPAAPSAGSPAPLTPSVPSNASEPAPERPASGASSAESGETSPEESTRRGGRRARSALEPVQGDVQPADFPETEAARRRRRRRPRSARPSEGAPEPESVEAEPPAPAPAAEAEPAAPRRRRRRGGGAEAQAQASVIPVEPSRTPAQPQPAPARKEQERAFEALESLVARQNVIFDTFTAKELVTLRSIERSLQVLNQRVGGELSMSSMSGAMPKVGIFVDVPNIMYAAERLGVQVDFGKLLHYLTRNRSLVRASAYAPISDDPQVRLETQKFVAPFVNHGYRIVTKPLKRFADGSIKANFDVELAMDVLTMSDRLDVVSLVSGDGDFRRLSELVASKGVRVEVVAFGQSTAGELRAVADEYVDLTDHLDELVS